jgi:hypothetical protein
MVVNAISGSCKREGFKHPDEVRRELDEIDRAIKKNPNMSMDEKNKLRDKMIKIERVVDRAGGDGNLRMYLDRMKQKLG